MRLDKKYLKNKMKENGFTLIELIAIILVLAIIVLIAIPFITRIVSEASKEAFKQTTKGTASAIERQCDIDVINNESIIDTYAVENYNVTIGGKINVNARLPLYANANVNEKCSVQIAAQNGKWCATKTFDEDKVTVTKYVEGECRIGTTGPVLVSGNDTWDGWINMTLYYPSASTERQWRLGSQGEVRYDENLMWQYYSGSITIPLSRVEDVWIRYNLDDKTVIIPPAGTVLVDIEPDSYGTNKTVESVKINITYDDTATVKEYRVGNSNWMTYTGEFTVTENILIEARASKSNNVYDEAGNLLIKRDAIGRDAVYIGNIGINETELAAPTIERLPAIDGSEVARVKVTYPGNATEKIYKLNYGVEQSYTDELSIKKYGTYVIAYYYDADGKRSKATGIYINNLDGTDGPGTPPGPPLPPGVIDPPTPYPPNPPISTGNPTPPGVPTYRIVAPTIIGTPESATTGSVTVTVNAPATADKIYIKQGNNKYSEYTGQVIVTDNSLITAYYVTYDGEVSERAYYRVTNIVKGTKPALTINADPYPYASSYGKTSVNISLAYSNANTVEYSEDGIVYLPYINSFNVYENKTIYARATNASGVTTAELSITNIGGYVNPPKSPTILSVEIYATPEPTVSTTIVNTVKVKIDYDATATQKYYTIGYGNALIPYVGEFDVTSNTTIYAYALSNDGTGKDSKVIDNMNTGIATPIIVGNPDNNTATSKTNITITYDKNATIKRYSVNNGQLREYTKSFDVSSNDVIYAYSQNVLGEVADATYKVNNIIPEPTIFLIDKGFYFILKLNYPALSKSREYKWEQSGSWKTYDEKGILLIKPEYKDELIDEEDNFKVGIEDDNGDIIDFTNHWYVIESSFTELEEFIFMRWDRTSLPKPQILLDTLEPTKEVNATIIYDSGVVKKQYKIVDDEGNIVQDWTSYSSAIKISENNTIIYARGQDDAEVWTDETVYKITNIDENQPVIKLTTDLVTATQKLGIKVVVTDDVSVSKVKWAKGIVGESYFASGGTEIPNNSVVNITENAYYTFYAEDGVGNKQVYTINVENIDLTPPIIDITVAPEEVIGITSSVTINYGDSTTKQYKIGDSVTWLTYTAAFNVSSYTVLTNNLQNADGTVTIYAKGKDSLGNEVIVTKKILNLDLDIPSNPVIVSSSGYPVISLYGVVNNAAVSITYDSRTDIDNYYSIDSGTTWIKYSGKFSLATGSVIAKSVKKSSNLEAKVTSAIGAPTDAITPLTYDGNETTYMTNVRNNYKILIDDSAAGKRIRMKYTILASRAIIFRFLDANNNIISEFTKSGSASYDEIYSIPANAETLQLTPYCTAGDGFVVTGQWFLYEITIADDPTFTATNGYMLIHSDITKNIVSPYQAVTINYSESSEQRLYQVGSTTGEWLTYNDSPIKVNQGSVIYAKGIDKNGKVTRIVSSYTANVTDALTAAAFDKNESTFMTGVKNSYKFDVDSSLIGHRIRFKYNILSSRAITFSFLDGNNNVISSFTKYGGASFDEAYIVPAGTKKIQLLPYCTAGDGYVVAGQWSLYEISLYDESLFTATTGYMLLHNDPTKAITSPYQMISINYFPTSIQKLYQIGSTTGTWLTYNNLPIKVNQGQTIYTKGIDKYGVQTNVISNYTVVIPDAITATAYDGNATTYMTAVKNSYLIDVDSSLIGRSVKFKYTILNARAITFSFLDANNNVISTFTKTGSASFDESYVIPAGTKRIRLLPYCTSGDQYIVTTQWFLYEITPQ